MIFSLVGYIMTLSGAGSSNKPDKLPENRPGMGLDENALADKIGHDWKNPEEYDKEGSVMDW